MIMAKQKHFCVGHRVRINWLATILLLWMALISYANVTKHLAENKGQTSPEVFPASTLCD